MTLALQKLVQFDHDLFNGHHMYAYPSREYLLKNGTCLSDKEPIALGYYNYIFHLQEVSVRISALDWERIRTYTPEEYSMHLSSKINNNNSSIQI